jgi:hypothetical protein
MELASYAVRDMTQGQILFNSENARLMLGSGKQGRQ